MLPWLVPSDQRIIFPDDLTFQTPEDQVSHSCSSSTAAAQQLMFQSHLQEKYVREWVDKRTGFATKFAIKWYPAHYDQHSFCSIFPVGKTACLGYMYPVLGKPYS